MLCAIWPDGRAMACMPSAAWHTASHGDGAHSALWNRQHRSKWRAFRAVWSWFNLVHLHQMIVSPFLQGWCTSHEACIHLAPAVRSTKHAHSHAYISPHIWEPRKHVRPRLVIPIIPSPCSHGIAHGCYFAAQVAQVPGLTFADGGEVSRNLKK